MFNLTFIAHRLIAPYSDRVQDVWVCVDDCGRVHVRSAECGRAARALQNRIMEGLVCGKCPTRNPRNLTFHAPFRVFPAKVCRVPNCECDERGGCSCDHIGPHTNLKLLNRLFRAGRGGALYLFLLTDLMGSCSEIRCAAKMCSCLSPFAGLCSCKGHSHEAKHKPGLDVVERWSVVVVWG